MKDRNPFKLYSLISNKVYSNYLCSNNAAVPTDNIAFLNWVIDLTILRDF